MKGVLITYVLLLFVGTLSNASLRTDGLPDFARSPEFIQDDSPWADSVFATLSLEDKIGQLFMIPAYSKQGKTHFAEVSKLITDYGVGGVIFMQGGPARQTEMLNSLQDSARIPLLIAMDAEWGPGMRLDSTVKYPRQMALGATRDPELAELFGRQVARELRQVGTHVNFAPVVDVNNNADNPVINSRAFGENAAMVAEMGAAYMRGMQDEKVMACAKHFPGHGDTDVDSHKDLPVILHDRDRLDSVEFAPFRHLITNGLASAMIAHLYIPSLDSTKLKPSTLSEKIVTGILREEMGFEGLVFTDAMTMQGIAKYFEPGEMDVQALVAGNDVLLFPGDVPKAVEQIKQAISGGTLSIEQIDDRCLRVLKAKEWCGVHEFTPLPKPVDMHLDEMATGLDKRIASASITVLKNRDQLLPIGKQGELEIAVLNIGSDRSNEFTKVLDGYIEFKSFQIAANPSFSTVKNLMPKLARYDMVICNVLGTSQRPSRKYGIGSQSMKLVSDLSLKTDVVINLFGNAYALDYIPATKQARAVTVAYHDKPVNQQCVAELLVGAGVTSARLPVSTAHYNYGDGLDLNEQWRLKHVPYGFVNPDPAPLGLIDSIVQDGISEQAFPGCRVLAVKDGNIFYDKSFGHQTYEKKIRVDQNTVYDLASITKIVSSTSALMKLQGDGKIDVNYNLCDYLEIPDTSSCFNINLQEMLSHYAKLKPWIPFYQSTLNSGAPDSSLYRTTVSEGFTTKVTDDLYILDSYRDSIFQSIIWNGLREEQEYKYSDLGYYFIQKLVEQIEERPLDSFVSDNFYEPMGLSSMGYHPLSRVDLDDIAPTEYDMYFRKQLIHGHVHDPGAAMMGGVGGHAGVFSGGEDLATMMQMLLNGGTYAGTRYLDAEVIDYFTQCHYCDDDNRRGIGFDKPTHSLNSGPTCNGASAASFGHSGFTGTLAWADPEHGIVYVFLSNRVYPNASNNKLLKMDIRTNIQDALYKALGVKDRAHRSPSVHSNH